jgi:hypothetical protein
MVNGNAGSTATKPNLWKLHQENTVNVAPGMDILLALGVNWIRYDKMNTDIKTASKASSQAVNAAV